MIELTESDVTFETSRSGGPGGQNVDRRATAVRARINLDDLSLSESKKQFLLNHIPPKNRAGEQEIYAECDNQRSQQQNKTQALKLLNEEINQAIERGRHAVEKKKRAQRVKQRNKGGGGGGSESIKDKKQKQFRHETMDDLLEQAYQEDPDTMEDFVDSPGNENTK